MLKIAIIAGEPSGDMLAASLMVELKARYDDQIQFMGIGGDHMILAGLKSSYEMSVLSIGGYGWDVISAVPKIYSMYKGIVNQIIDFKPDVFIGVDAPGFNLRVEKKLKQHGIKIVHYVSPTIWAWKYERIYEIKKFVDLMLCIFPMEEAIYAKEGIKAKFVGHHLADKIELDIDTQQYRKILLEDLCKAKSYSLPSNLTNPIVIAVLVGSRHSEIINLGQIFIEACNIIHSRISNAIFLFSFVSPKIKLEFEQLMSKMVVKFHYCLLLNQTRVAIKASDLALVKSGTVTLEVALCKKPMVVIYKVSKLTAWILKRKLKTKYVSQPNLILNEEVAPEYLQDAATAENLANEILNIYNDDQRKKYIINKFYELHKILKHDASKAAALAVLDLINASK